MQINNKKIKLQVQPLNSESNLIKAETVKLSNNYGNIFDKWQPQIILGFLAN